MATPVSQNPYELTNAILKDAGVNVRQLSGSSYSGLVEAVRVGVESGEFPEITVQGNTVLIDGYSADHPMFRNVANGSDEQSDGSSCPDWLPANLCVPDLFSKASRAMSPGGFFEETFKDNPIIAKLGEIQARFGVGALGFALIVLAVIFIAWSSVKTPVKQAARVAIRKGISS